MGNEDRDTDQTAGRSYSFGQPPSLLAYGDMVDGRHGECREASFPDHLFFGRRVFHLSRTHRLSLSHKTIWSGDIAQIRYSRRARLVRGGNSRWDDLLNLSRVSNIGRRRKRLHSLSIGGERGIGVVVRAVWQAPLAWDPAPPLRPNPQRLRLVVVRRRSIGCSLTQFGFRVRNRFGVIGLAASYMTARSA